MKSHISPKELQILGEKPQDLELCCRILKLRRDGELLKDIIASIKEFTGYGRALPKIRGQEVARFKSTDKSLNWKFKNIVLDFFNDTAPIFFPMIIPADKWSNSWVDVDDRLEAKSKADEKYIIAGLLLLFEFVKANPYAIDTTDMSVSPDHPHQPHQS